MSRTLLLRPPARPRLDLEVLVEARHAVLAADAAVLVAAEGQVGAVRGAAVDAEATGADALGHGERVLDRAGEHATGQAVLAVVGDAHRVVLVVERDDHEDRAEDLLLGDRHGVVDVGEQRRLDPPALGELVAGGPSSADGQRGALGLPLLDVAEDAVALLGRDHRAHDHVGSLRVAVGHGGEHALEHLDALLVARAGQQHPGLDGAALAGVEAGAHAHQRGEAEVGVVEHDRGRLAAELEEDALHGGRALLHDALAHRGRAGERDHVDLRRQRELLADEVVRRRDDVDDARPGCRSSRR